MTSVLTPSPRVQCSLDCTSCLQTPQPTPAPCQKSLPGSPCVTHHLASILCLANSNRIQYYSRPSMTPTGRAAFDPAVKALFPGSLLTGNSDPYADFRSYWSSSTSVMYLLFLSNNNLPLSLNTHSKPSPGALSLPQPSDSTR